MTKNELRLKKYHMIVNVYGNVKFNKNDKKTVAQISSDWGEKRILLELGIDINKIKSIPKIREVKERAVQNKRNDFIKYQTLKPIYGTLESFANRKLPKKVVKKKFKNALMLESRENLLNVIKEKTHKQRKDEWAFYSQRKKEHKEHDFPKYLLDVIYSYNLEKGLDIQNHYGFALINMVYTNEYTYEQALQYITADEQSFKGYYYNTNVAFKIKKEKINAKVPPKYKFKPLKAV